jgi:hypothetical protein
MSNDRPTKPGVKQRLERETREYLATAAFFTVFAVSLTTYRKLVLAEYHVGYYAYGWAVVKALILAKVVLIGEAMHLGKRMHDVPLIVSTILQSLVYGILNAIFVLAEHVVKALLHHQPIASELQFSGGQGYEMLARVQLMFVIFIPFFALRELSLEVGEGELFGFFFHRRASRNRGNLG